MGKRSTGLALIAAVACGAAACEAVSQRGQQASSTSATTTTSGGGGATGGSGTALDAGSDDGLSPLDASGYCGNQVHQVLSDVPNLYFVFDISGSMSDPAGGGLTKYQIVEHSAVAMIQTLGPLINVGAAVFPHNASNSDPCHVGAEVFPVTPGDPKSIATGPTTGGFILATSVQPSGGTPTAATLTALQPGLVKLKGRTVVLLSTDGGPNCNAALTCSKDQCIPNLEGTCVNPTTNCCAPGGASGGQGCLDHDASVAAVGALAAAQIPVVVIGVPGSDLYASVLDDMAVAGGEPRPGSPAYYQVDDLSTLTQTFQTIAAAFISCDFVLQDPPADQDHTNVYTDGTLLLADPANGWVWKGPAEITLVGAACAELKAGKVSQVQIISGCPTQKSS